MRYLIHSSLAMTSARAILYDETEKLIRQGHEVYFLYCDNLLDSCFINPQGAKAECLICKKNYSYEQKLLSNKIIFLSLNKELKKRGENIIDPSLFAYNSIQDIKKITFNGISVGYACLSSYITATRNLNPLIDNDFRIYFDSLIRNCIKLSNILNNLVDEIKPSTIILFNGRLIENRPLWEIAKKKGISFYSIEMAKKVDSLSKTIFKNSTPHFIENTAKQINNVWDISEISLNERVEVGESFFKKRRNAQYTGDKIYIENQNVGLLPENWDERKHNVVIFNSSEDEFAAIGSFYEEYSLFPSQYKGLEAIFEHFSNDQNIHFYLRIHPNLKAINYKYHTELYRFDAYNNVNVIPPDSAISSYSLLDAANKVIVFGSTMGAEAVYWGKPTILLCGADYYHLNCCYIPLAKNELFELINKELQPMDSMPVIKYGYYLLNTQFGNPTVIDFNYSYKIVKILSFQRKISVNNWLKLFGSRTMYSVFRYTVDSIIRLVIRKVKYKIPTKEI